MRLVSRGRLWILIFTVLVVTEAAGASIYVICNEKLDLKSSDIKNAYTGAIESVGSVRLFPVENKKIEEEFLSKVLGLGKEKYEAVWAKRVFQDGVRQPSVESSDTEVIAHVKNTPGGLGYVSTDPGPSVKILQKY